MELSNMYKQVAEALATKINSVFETEETMSAWFSKHFSHLPFDRTNHWSGLIYLLFREAWIEAGPEVKGEPTGFDRTAVLKRLAGLLDYNLFTQVLLNLQPYTAFAYQALDAEKDLAAIEEKWKEKKRTPTDSKAK